MHRLLFAFALVVFTAQLVLSQPTVTREEYAVYSIAFRSLRQVPNFEPKLEHLVIVTDTSTPDFSYDFLAPKFRWLVKDLSRRNAVPAKLDPKFLPFLNYSLVEKQEIDNMLETDKKNFQKERQKLRRESNRDIYSVCGPPWKSFHAKFSEAQGYFQVSRIGFSSNRRFAMVELQGHGECWSGYWTYIFKKIGKEWRIYENFGSFGIA